MNATLDSIIAIIRPLRFNCVDEREFQDGIELALQGAGIVFEREYRLSAKDRIDFYIPAGSVGIEVKVKGGPSDVLRQCLGYAQYEAIGSLLLITSRLRLALPEMLNNKPARTLSLWMQGF